MEAIFFWGLSLIAIACAISVVVCRSPVSSALSLALTFGTLAALFVTLGAFFLAAVQVIVYAGAVMVLFLFIIMFLDVKAESKRPIPWVTAILAIGVGLLLLTYFAEGILPSTASVPSTISEISETQASLTTHAASENSLLAIGELLFNQYLLTTITTAVLLLVSTIGVVLLSKNTLNEEKDSA